MRTIIIALAMLLALPAVATATQPQQKLPICHRTAADTNPYVIIRPDSASWYAHLDLHVNHNPKHGRADFFAFEWSDGSFRCEEEEAWDPKAAFGPFCGDPWTFGKFKNGQSDVPTAFTMIWTNGRGEKRVKTKIVPAGGWDRTKWRWVKLGSVVSIKARPAGTSVPRVLLAQRTVTRTTHWGVGACPALPVFLR